MAAGMLAERVAADAAGCVLGMRIARLHAGGMKRSVGRPVEVPLELFNSLGSGAMESDSDADLIEVAFDPNKADADNLFAANDRTSGRGQPENCVSDPT